MNDRYSDQLDNLDASVFSGELLFTNMDEFQDYINRWQRAIDRHKNLMDYVGGDTDELKD